MSLVLIIVWSFISIWFLFLTGFAILMVSNIGIYETFLQMWWMFLFSIMFLIFVINHFTFVKYLEKKKPKLISSLLMKDKSSTSLLSRAPTAMKLQPIEFISYCKDFKNEKDKKIKKYKIIYLLSSSLFIALFIALWVYFWFRG